MTSLTERNEPIDVKWVPRALNLCGIVVALAVSSGTGMRLAHAQVPLKLSQAAAEIEACLAGHMNNLRDAPSEPNAFTRMFIFEEILKSLGTGQTLTSPPEKLCIDVIVPAYTQARAKTLDERRHREPDALAPLGSTPIEADSTFIRLTFNHTALHTQQGHSDLTAATVEELGDEMRFTKLARELVVRGSQAPDLYRWSDERYHAHTPDYHPAELGSRERAIEYGKTRFSSLLKTLFTDMKGAAERRAYADALFLLGVTCHSVQDMVYHRGMTIRQHAGLAYTLRRNPDFPEPPFDAQRAAEARRYTTAVLRRAKAIIAPTAWNNMLAWSPPSGFDFRAVAERVFNSKQDIGVVALLDYWALSLPYGKGRPLDDLADDPSCKTGKGRACWDIDSVLREALK